MPGRRRKKMKKKRKNTRKLKRPGRNDPKALVYGCNLDTKFACNILPKYLNKKNSTKLNFDSIFNLIHFPQVLPASLILFPFPTWSPSTIVLL